MIQKEDQQIQLGPDAPAIGVDVGATLAKLAVREASGEFSFGFLPASGLDAVVRRIRALDPQSVGLTGCGAGSLEPHIDRPVDRVVEFEAWGRGSDELLRRQQVEVDEAYMMVSVGTGTSALRVEHGHATRLGGTALGGGTVLGLGVALTGCESYEELCGLAEKGQRATVDLMVGDIYTPGEIALPGHITAACFGNLARWLTHGAGPGAPASGEPSKREDLAAAVMGLVGENVGLICCGLAGAASVRRIVYGGATLLNNPALSSILMGVTTALGHHPLMLAEGGFAGAVGALLLAAR